MSIKPITPEEVINNKAERTPENVIAAWNEVITENYDNGVSSFTQEKLITRILEKMPNSKRHEIFDNGWLNLEPVFRLAGWSVEYDKPGFNETYEAHFIFKKRHTKRNVL